MADFSTWERDSLVKFCEEATRRMLEQDAERSRLMDKHNALHASAATCRLALRRLIRMYLVDDQAFDPERETDRLMALELSQAGPDAKRLFEAGGSGQREFWVLPPGWKYHYFLRGDEVCAKCHKPDAKQDEGNANESVAPKMAADHFSGFVGGWRLDKCLKWVVDPFAKPNKKAAGRDCG